ncbi:leucine dehydrogenase [Hydrocarboniphaga daqingensis]|uniref:Leucine dehydrogenase n=1 Tax=Hydrocarboniphaga daqingensis TaxID=490188 RepID=A0A1M5R882_9GAMM|nr:Glu/Leu/Phe/Val dehydrogenase dimerization domain-containing protein [Hydrocarboniphaga daqingensis]SHH22544.1 leucine dehydrogenase [Hydrocarboniphaga daqingensis]
MSVFAHPEFDAHEIVAFHHDRASGLKAIIAVHDTQLGQGLGGCRMFPYATDDDALTDVLRLSRGMTYKAALAGLRQGGGKSVIIGDPRAAKTPELIDAMGRFVERLGGQYVVAEDSGTSVADIRRMAAFTRHVGGLADAASTAAGRTGDPSPATALGVFYGLRAAVRHQLGRDDLRGLRVAIQGVGNVGHRLAGHLHAAGAELWVTDAYAPSVDRCVAAYGARAVAMNEIYGLDVDVFAPCALGAVLNDRTIPLLQARVIAGAANNQLAEPRHDHVLMERGILYAPDYVINAGGIIDIYYEGEHYDAAVVDAHLQRIGTTLAAIFQRSAAEHRPTGSIADKMAEEIFRRR